MCYTLPKIWMGRIQKYWDRIIPSDFPQSSSEFSIKFNSDEAALAVNKLENEIGTEESVLTNFVPEGNFITKYVGTYNVTGKPNVKTLLSPNKVTGDKVIAIHLNEETGEWENIEDACVEDGYAWGTLTSFSPIAIFEYKKDIEIVECDHFPAGVTAVVANGLSIKLYSEDDKVFVVGPTGVPVELTSKTYIVGGSVDGTPIESTNVSVVGVKNSNIVNKIIAGSSNWNFEEATTVKTANLTIIDSIVGCSTGSSGSVRTEQLNINIKDSKLSWFGCGESFSDVLKKDVNKANCSFASLAWVKNVDINVENINTTILYMGGNTGFFYVDNTKCNVLGSNIDYLLSGGSNGATKESIVSVSNDSNIGIYQSTNRGEVVSAEANFVNSNVENLFIGGDSTDNTVTGVTRRIKVNVNNGTGKYHIAHGVEGGKPITYDQIKEIVDTVKVSRNADVTIDDTIRVALADKYIIK